jgi:hypothetical protein
VDSKMYFMFDKLLLGGDVAFSVPPFPSEKLA